MTIFYPKHSTYNNNTTIIVCVRVVVLRGMFGFFFGLEFIGSGFCRKKKSILSLARGKCFNLRRQP